MSTSVASLEYDVTAEIDRRRIGSYQLFLFVLCGLVIALDGFDIQIVSFTAPILAGQVGVPVAEFGIAFSSGLTGLMAGTFIISPFGDRMGRKRLIQISCFIFGVFTIVTAYTTNLTELVIVRFIAGVGLGGCIPNALALVSEFAPRAAREKVITLVVSATPGGAMLGGIACALLIPHGHWRTVYWIGGLLPLLGSVALVWVLPESIRFMVAADRPAQRILALLRRIAPDFVAAPGARFVRSDQIVRGAPFRRLFTDGFAERTLLLWVPYFMVFLISFLLSSWLPSVLRAAGLPLTEALMALIVFNLGGVIGAVLLGKVIDWLGVFATLGLAFLLCAIAVAALGHVAGFYSGVMAVILVVGVCVQGTICCLYALAAATYPVTLRATGIGWASGAGRFGAIFGPLWGGLMLQAGWTLPMVFGSAAVPAVISILALLRLSVVTRRADHAAAPALAPGAGPPPELG